MSETYPFDPDWVVCPGAIVDEICQERGIDEPELGYRLGLHGDLLMKLLDGRLPVTPALATALAKLYSPTGSPLWEFWLRVEETYRIGLADGKIHSCHPEDA